MMCILIVLFSFYSLLFLFFFFFNDTATTEIYTLSLHDALPICAKRRPACWRRSPRARSGCCADRKSTRLNSSHVEISYAVFCLKKKKKDKWYSEHYTKDIKILYKKRRCKN